MTLEDAYWTIGLTVAAGIVSIELYDWSGRFAEKVLPMAARLWTKDPEWREIYAEAWLADIEDCPGKLWRLVMAASFFVRGVMRCLSRVAVAGAQYTRKRFRRTSPLRTAGRDRVDLALLVLQILCSGGVVFGIFMQLRQISLTVSIITCPVVVLGLVLFNRYADRLLDRVLDRFVGPFIARLGNQGGERPVRRRRARDLT